MAEVNPFDIEFAEDDEKYSKPSYTGSRGGGLYKKSLKALEKERERNKIRKEYPSLTDEQADELIEMRKRNKGMLDWSEDLQRAVMTEELKKSRPDLSDEQIQEKVDYEMVGSDFTLDDTVPPSEEQSEYDTPEREEFRQEVINKYLKQPPEGWDNMPTSEKEDFIHGLLKDVGERFFPLSDGVSDDEEIDVPEIETEVVDLPPEDENEKEIVIDRNEDTINPDATIAGDNGPDFKPEDMTDPEIVENQFEDLPDRVTDEEVADAENADTETAATEDASKKEEPKEEQKKTMSDEDALKEAQELAQDELLGFKISGANWEKMSEKQKAEAIKAFKDANKKEDHSTNIDKSEKNNYSSYERYPTGLKVTEDALSEVNTVAGGIKDAAHKIGQQGTNSGSISNEVARAVPHYDYRSLFR